MPTVSEATTARPAVRSAALIGSSLVVAAVAAGFDVLADERPVHTLSLVLVAAAVGVVRWVLRGRLRGLFVLVNLAVVAQPVAHGLAKLTDAGAGLLPHSHDLPGEVPGLAIQVAVGLLVAVVAGSEPIAVAVASSLLATVCAVAVAARTSRPRRPAPPARPAGTEHASRPVHGLVLVRCRPHRGPPALVGSAA